MNFITDLLKNRVYKNIYDAVLNVINKFSKIYYYILYQKNMITKDCVKKFV